MQISRYSFQDVNSFSLTDVAYQSQESALQPFYLHNPELEAFQDVIDIKKHHDIDRELLVTVARDGYRDKNLQVPENLENLLNENAFTVITAHQPSLLTGPLYFILKIASTINLARTLNKKYASNQIIPVFIMGGEDHDFEEINHFHLFGKTLVWNTNQSGSVGRMTLDGLAETLSELESVLGTSENAMEIKSFLSSAVEGSTTYGQFMFKFVEQLFRHTELIILGMDNPLLKKRFASVMKDDLFNHTSQKIVPPTQELLIKAGYGTQAYCREINLFYLLENSRERIEKNGDRFEVVGTQLSFSQQEIELEFENHPERFSPNVILRPLFQETILPNLAYIGGGGELAYWMERKTQFEYYNIPYPILMRRNSILWVDESQKNQLQKLDLEVKDLFDHEDQIINRWVDMHSENELNITDELEGIASALDKIIIKAKNIDPTLSKSIAAEKVKMLKNVEQLGGRLIRSEKQQFENSLNKIRKLKSKLFPEGGLQERYENFIPFYLKYGKAFVDTLIDNLDPLDRQFLVCEGDIS